MRLAREVFGYFDLNMPSRQALEPDDLDDWQNVASAGKKTQPSTLESRPAAPSTIIGARESGYSGQPNLPHKHAAKLSIASQCLLYFGTFLGVLLSLTVHRIEAWQSGGFD